MRSWTVLLCLLVAAVLPACTPPNGTAEGAADAPTPPASTGSAMTDSLSSSVQVTVYEDSVVFALQVTNTSASPLQLQFNSGQTHDFVVTRGGEEVWRWSEGRMFTQALQQRTLAAGETLSFRESWTPPAGAEGEYRVTGVLTAADHPVRQQASFSLP